MKLWFSNKGVNPGKLGNPLPKNLNVKLPQNFNVQTATNFLQQMLQMLKSPPSGPTPTGPPRHMKYPYTFSAKLAQFPYKFYYKTNWIAKYSVWGFISCLPIFCYISKLSNSKENKAKWKEIRRLEKEKARHRFDEY